MPDPNDHPTPTAPYLAEGHRTALRRFTEADAEEFTARARESRAHHRPWLFPPERTDTYAAYADVLARDPGREGFLVCERGEGGPGGQGEAGGAIAGFININNIVLGGFRCGALGYGAFAHAAGRGLMGEALGLVMDLAFGPLGLHRLEANIQPGNAASIALVRRAGFRLEGFSPDFLHIDGAWRDHERWAITAPAS
ncbi:acetyltransferase [Streptomyces sp. CB00316]|uniref:GNAT family N-acetyltransferase n=1 Tax=unclassified Streptomyces TaxID=2593676 RepID=UPI00093CA6C5|nr:MULTISPECIES: GNAT family protein [unclassified Streptomyces]MBT2380909.1 GNAT family N-acetyltransferase [Streptomyces sp. ISL-111]MBT2429680.1 GNAT family N-acetyltransferase [Streptomyces sp. ISL-112]MBT2464797.1 GNAT family N-acetyltransferase [Streptomyces sp. ISL-63]OKJ21415.1 acetyltransferase [Streptomyces sp. CB00316]